MSEQTLTPAPDASELITTWMTHDPMARLMVGERRRLLWANDTALAALDNGCELHLIDGALTLGDHARTDLLDRQLRRGSFRPSTWCLEQPEGGSIVFCIQRVSPQRDPAVIGVTFHLTATEFHQAWANFAVVLRLTPAEHRVALALLEGERVHAIASVQQVSEATVRTHVKRLYEKTGVHSREGLFRALAPYRIL